MNVKECIEKGLLVKNKPDKKKAFASLEMAEHKLEIAKQEVEHKIFESALVSAYTSMFHASRALLFRDGFKERSHFAVSVFLGEKYSSQIQRKHLTELNALRLQRHELMYGLEQGGEAQESNADSAIKTAEEFLETIKKILKKEM